MKVDGSRLSAPVEPVLPAAGVEGADLPSGPPQGCSDSSAVGAPPGRTAGLVCPAQQAQQQQQ